MHITLHPRRSDATISAAKHGDMLVINGMTLDFTPLPIGATLPAGAVDCDYIVGSVERISGVLHITLLLPHGADASDAVRYPDPILNPPDGPLELPQ